MERSGLFLSVARLSLSGSNSASVMVAFRLGPIYGIREGINGDGSPRRKNGMKLKKREETEIKRVSHQ